MRSTKQRGLHPVTIAVVCWVYALGGVISTSCTVRLVAKRRVSGGVGPSRGGGQGRGCPQAGGSHPAPVRCCWLHAGPQLPGLLARQRGVGAGAAAGEKAGRVAAVGAAAVSAVVGVGQAFAVAGAVVGVGAAVDVGRAA